MERRKLLNLYLNRYNKVKNRINALKNTYEAIRIDSESPYQSSYSKDVKVQSSPSADGMIRVMIQLEDIENRIKEQQMNLVKRLTEILDVLDFLPSDSDERSILEMKYIQKQSDKAIYTSMYISKSQFYKLRNKALDELLRYSKVNKILCCFEKELMNATEQRD